MYTIWYDRRFRSYHSGDHDFSRMVFN